MIITCPRCSTRYDIEETSLGREGRSVRCAACEECWFVPAPEPVTNLLRASSVGRAENRATPQPNDVGEEDQLFDIVDPDVGSEPVVHDEARLEDERSQPRRDMSYDEDDRRWRRGAEESDEDYRDDPRHDARDDAAPARPVVDAHFEDLRANPHADRQARPSDSRGFEPESDEQAYADALLAEEDYDDRSRGFGRRLREERRRSTALTRIESLDETAERVFNDEFFKALHVQPKHLEKAIRKARRRAETREKNRLTPLRVLGWTAWLAVVSVTVFALYTYRDPIVNAWPNASAAYAAIGIEAEPKGLKIRDVAHRLAASTRGPSLEITGKLTNDSEAGLPAPLMQAEALGSDGALLARWTFEVETSVIEPGESAEFMTRAAAPAGVAEIILTFAPSTARPRIGPGSALEASPERSSGLKPEDAPEADTVGGANGDADGAQRQ